MNLLLLGHGKTGALVEEVARQRGHSVRVLTSKDNPHASALGADHLRGVDALIDFTTPEAVVENIEACIRARKPIVVGTTGWYQHISRFEEQVRKENAAVLYGSNFSIGVNIFFEIAAVAATSEVSVSLTVDSTEAIPAIAAELEKLADVKYEGRKAIVCLVGENIRGTRGIAAKVFGALPETNVRMISQGASEINISFVIEEDDVEETVRTLHQVFFADPDPSVFA